MFISNLVVSTIVFYNDSHSEITGINQSMSITNRASLPPTSQNPAPTRFGFIPRSTPPGLQTSQGSSLAERSRSISPSSTNSANSTSSTPQRLAKTQTVSKATSNRSVTPSSNAPNVSKPKLPPSKTTTTTTPTNRIRSNTTSQVSTPSVLPTKTDVNAIRDRYKTQKRMNFFTRRTPGTSSLKSPSIETSVIKEEKNEQSTDVSIDNSQVIINIFLKIRNSIIFLCRMMI
jgi:hypothetical protein